MPGSVALDPKRDKPGFSDSLPFDKLRDQREGSTEKGKHESVRILLGTEYKRILMVKGPGVRDEGRGDLGVRFDKLNELRVRKSLSLP